ncbi:unnamed protein product [Ranitomeya imitator]|uniref:Actin-associated protein FAM107A n=1 Tax=Ranitomeya imitator TaxID=111125 RepID=A0ABN9L859_9NEOB|nr:unnamed protein product [Ranitomeya imitator]
MDGGKKGLKDREIEGTVKISGGSLMICGCFTAKGIGYFTRIDGGLSAELYVSIPQDELLHTLGYYGCKKDDLVFQQDNDPKHTSRLAKKWFNDNEVEVLDRPLQSPDHNPIKHLGLSIDKKPELQRVLENRRRDQIIQQKRQEEETKKMQSPFEQELLKRQQRLEQLEKEEQEPKDEAHAPEFIKVKENLRRTATLPSDEKVIHTD